jgi:EAL domain-containing protein (putative c-di-GMP-specific phosphodiesterase class I)
LPISTIKIDKEFIRDITKNNESQAVIKFITNIAELLNLTTICEGVETFEEFDMVKALGCDTIQGWLIGKSMKDEDALKIVDSFEYNAVVVKKHVN